MGVGWSVGWLGTYFRNNWYIRVSCMSGRTQGPPLHTTMAAVGFGPIRIYKSPTPRCTVRDVNAF
jgi:hypothetical protein